MGMDGVELVMDVEDHFGIALTEVEIKSMITVGDLVVICRQRILATETSRCVYLQSFLSLRTQVREIADAPWLRFHPSENIANRLSRSTRRKLWGKLHESFGLIMPSLHRPLPLRIFISLLFAGGLGTILFQIIYELESWPISIFSIMAIPVAVVLYFSTFRLRTELPNDWETFGQIVTHITSLQVAIKPTCSAESDAILEELRPILINVLGVDDDEITPTARFIEDLGMS